MVSIPTFAGTWRSMRTIPNRAGFTLYAIDGAGHVHACSVVFDAAQGLHRITGAQFSSLVGWKPR